ncbi:MAG: cytochrome c [Gammaproteobacteria bacterium]|nr:cytochrome c [Gammaproteobacteria bacterium]
MKKIIVFVGFAILGLLIQQTAKAGGDAAAGKEKAALCATCHGADGNSPSPEFPILAGQYADYIVAALQQYQDGRRTNAIMMPFAINLTKQEMEDLAAYFASQEGPLQVLQK